MRWPYIISRLSALAAIWLIVFFLFDPALKWAAIRGGESAAGAKVEIKGLKTEFFPPSLAVSGVTVADRTDPWKNIIQFDSLRMSLEGRPLLEKKIIVREASLEGLRTGTKREKSGELPKRKKTDSSVFNAFKKIGGQGADLALARTEDIKSSAKTEIKADTLESAKLADKLKAGFEDKTKELEKLSDTNGIENRVNSISKAFEEIRDAKNPADKLKKIKGLKDDAAILKSEIESSRTKINSAMDEAKSSLSVLEDAKKRDLNALLKQFGVPSLDAGTISSYLLGPSAAAKTATALHWMDLARSRMSAKSVKKETGISRKGVDVPFPKETSYPAFLLRKMRISGFLTAGGTDMSIMGTAEGFTSEPRVYGKPALLKLAGASGSRKASLSAILDYTGDIPADKLAIQASGLPLSPTASGKPSSFTLETQGGTGSAEGTIELKGNYLKGDISLSANGISAKINSQDKRVNSLLSAAAKNLRSIKIKIALSGTLDNPSMSVASDAGDTLSSPLRSAAGGEIEAKKRELQSQIDKTCAPAKSELEDKIESTRKGILDKLGGSDGKLAELQKKITEKLTKEGVGKILPKGLKLPGLKF